MVKRTGVYIVTYDYDRNAWMNHQERLLKEFHKLSDKRYDLVDNPDDADIILVVDVWENIWEKGLDCWSENIGNHPIINQYPEKSFLISDIDSPVVLHHGVYASGEKRLLSAGRVCTGSYTLFFPNLINPFVEKHVFDISVYGRKNYLFSFIGRNSNPIRSRIFDLTFERNDVLVQDSSKFDFFSNTIEEQMDRQRFYFETLLTSKFSLCPRGSGASSIRLFESMQLGVVPVIISDAWIYPHGIKWSEFSIILKEKDIRDLERIITSFESSFQEMGLLARKIFEENFTKETYLNFIVGNCIHIRDTQWVPEKFAHKFINPVILQSIKIKDKVCFRSRMKRFLQAMHILRR
jgi:hypothetical protein